MKIAKAKFTALCNKGLPICAQTRRGKTLRIGVLGFKPYVTMDRRDELGRPDGTDMRLLRLLEDKMGFTAEINFITSFRGVVEEVGSYTGRLFGNIDTHMGTYEKNRCHRVI